MTWKSINSFIRILKCAAVFVAHFVFAGQVVAQDVTFRSVDNAVAVTGRFIAFDGSIATVLTDGGLVSFRAENMICEDPICPDFESYSPTVRMIGAQQMGDLLMPALIDAYARDNGWRAREDEAGFQLEQSDGTLVLGIELTVASPNDAFATFLNHDADILLSTRELRRSELDTAAAAGLGRLNTARQGRILALDALVPVASPSSDVRSISLSDLTDALTGENSSFEVHLPEDLNGQLQGFEDRFMRPYGLSYSAEKRLHPNREMTIQAVEESENGIALLPFGNTGNTQPLALTGPCGLRSEARFLTMKTEDYPLTLPMFLYLPRREQHPTISTFLDWLRSPSAQLVIRRAGFVDLAAVPISLGDQGDRLANAITNAGPEVPLTELQRLVRVLSVRVRMSSTFRFEPGSTRLDGQSRSNVMQLAQAIRDGRFGGRELMFVGFSDGRGPAEANRDLSAARAEAVRRDVEMALGGDIPNNVQIDTQAFGEALPMACDDTIWGQQTNRRVELWVRDVP